MPPSLSQSECEADLSADAPARGEAGAVRDQVLGVEGLDREVAEPRARALLFPAAEKKM